MAYNSIRSTAWRSTQHGEDGCRWVIPGLLSEGKPKVVAIWQQAIVEWVLAALTTQLAGLAVAFAVSRQHGVRATLLVLRFVPPPLPWPRRGSRTTRGGPRRT